MIKDSKIHAACGKAQAGQVGQHQQIPSQRKHVVSLNLEPQTWVQLAADVTDGLLDASKYKSLAVYAEVRLTEALDKAAQACPSSLAAVVPDDCCPGQALPNTLVTAVCCQLLGEVADMCGPFQPTLLKLREVLLPAIYSSCSGPSMTGSRPLQMEVLPWFVLAGRLRRQNNQLMEQHAEFTQDLAQHKRHMAFVEQQLETLQSALEAGTLATAALQTTNAKLVSERVAAVSEAAAAVDEVKKLSAEVLRLTAELDDLKEQLHAVKEEYSNDQEQWKVQLDVYLRKLQVEATERAAAVALASTEHQELEQKLWEVQRKLEEAEQTLSLQQCTAGMQLSQQEQQQQQDLTPRPTMADWAPSEELAAACTGTAEAIRLLQQQHTADAALMQRQLLLLSALVQPEPAPKPWHLNLTAEALKYFITELDMEDGDHGTGEAGDALLDHQQRCQPKAKLRTTGLGLGSAVPRFLRWDRIMELEDCSVQDTELQVKSIWKAKAAFEAQQGPCQLQCFLHQHFWQQAMHLRVPPVAVHADADTLVQINCDTGGPEKHAADTWRDCHDEQIVVCLEQQPAGAAAVIAVARHSQPASTAAGQAAVLEGLSVEANATTSGRSGLIPSAASHHVEIMSEAAAAGYQLYYACSQHRHSSAAVDLFWQVLTGQLQEEVVRDWQRGLGRLVQGLQDLSIAAATTAKPQDVLPTSQEDQVVAASGSASQLGSQFRSDPSVLWSDVQAAVKGVFPNKPDSQLQALTGWLATACGVSGDGVDPNTGSNASTGASDSPAGSMIQNRAAEVHTTASCLVSVCSVLKQELSWQRSTGTCGSLPAEITAAAAALMPPASDVSEMTGARAADRAGDTVATTSRNRENRQVFNVYLLLRHLLQHQPQGQC